MTDDSYMTHLAWVIRELKTEIEIHKSIIRTIEEIRAMKEDGVLSSFEWLEISKRIGW